VSLILPSNRGCADHAQFYRVAFFLTLAFSAIGPLAALAMLHSWQEVYTFIGKVVIMILICIVSNGLQR
jgi:hypothetical protein